MLNSNQNMWESNLRIGGYPIHEKEEAQNLIQNIDPILGT